MTWAWDIGQYEKKHSRYNGCGRKATHLVLRLRIGVTELAEMSRLT